MQELKPGIKGRQEITVSIKDTAEYLKSGMLKVYATPSLIALMEYTAFMSVEACLTPEQGTVGTVINMRHISATSVGKRVVCESELVEVDKKRLVFNVVARDAKGVIGECVHERIIIDKERFEQKLQNKYS